MKKTVQIVTVPLNTDSQFEAQQLLVLSDDKIQPGDFIYRKNELDVANDEWDNEIHSEWKKVIASYPILSNELTDTLPLSKETIQQWIDNGTPKECSVEMGTFYTGFYIGKCKNCSKEFTGDKRWYHCKECSEKSMITDSQGNLILEFTEKTVKASTIPTDEEIEEKAENYINNNTPNRTPSESDNWNEADCHFAFLNGYKQALKDLGYDK